MGIFGKRVKRTDDPETLRNSLQNAKKEVTARLGSIESSCRDATARTAAAQGHLAKQKTLVQTLNSQIRQYLLQESQLGQFAPTTSPSGKEVEVLASRLVMAETSMEDARQLVEFQQRQEQELRAGYQPLIAEYEQQLADIAAAESQLAVATSATLMALPPELRAIT